MSQARTGAWWRQARNDLELAELARSNGFHAQACFYATQVAEKALKGVILELGSNRPVPMSWVSWSSCWRPRGST